MKTTTVRKLLPESWGYLCPVHTPDGGPCGLLNHLAKEAVIISYPTSKKLPLTPTGILTSNSMNFVTGNDLKKVLVSLGMIPTGDSNSDGNLILKSGSYITILVDGIVYGGINVNIASLFVSKIRMLKVTGQTLLDGYILDPTTEVAHIPYSKLKGAYPGMSLSSLSSVSSLS